MRRPPGLELSLSEELELLELPLDELQLQFEPHEQLELESLESPDDDSLSLRDSVFVFCRFSSEVFSLFSFLFSAFVLISISAASGDGDAGLLTTGISTIVILISPSLFVSTKGITFTCSDVPCGGLFIFSRGLYIQQ